MMVVLMIMKIKSSSEAALLVYFQVGVAADHRRALLSAGPQPGDAPAAVGVSFWLRYTGADRAALLLLCPAQRHQRHGSGQGGEAGLRLGGLGLRGWGGPDTKGGVPTAGGGARTTMTCQLRRFYLLNHPSKGWGEHLQQNSAGNHCL